MVVTRLLQFCYNCPNENDLILDRIHKIEITDVMVHEINNEYHAKITGFP